MKILVISHTPLTTYEAMGKTIATFFSSFEKHEVAQLYIYPSFPDTNICDSYYRVTDLDVLKGYFHFGQYGGVVNPQTSSGDLKIYEDEKIEKLYLNKRNKSVVMVIMRDLMWKYSRWYNKNLVQWLDEICPDCIFLSPGGAKFIYEVARRIAKDRGIPIITYIADDYYFLQTKGLFLEKWKKNSLCRVMKRTFESSSSLITICKEMEDVYREIFGRKTYTIMTGSSNGIYAKIKEEKVVRALSYFGKMSLDRYVSLIDIGVALDKSNLRYGNNVCLNIYSGEVDAQIMRMFNDIQSVKFHGFLSGEKFRQVFMDSDMLVHVEAFDAFNVDKVRYSVSTKIADSLASGIPLLAYGPRGIASMEHLIRNNCALNACSKSDLEDLINKIVSGNYSYKSVVENAIKTAELFHNTKKNSDYFRSICNSVLCNNDKIKR